MGETTEDPPFSPGYVSLRQLGNSNRILRLEYLKNCAEEGIRVFKEKTYIGKNNGEIRASTTSGYPVEGCGFTVSRGRLIWIHYLKP